MGLREGITTTVRVLARELKQKSGSYRPKISKVPAIPTNSPTKQLVKPSRNRLNRRM